jgi:KTSC domain
MDIECFGVRQSRRTPVNRQTLDSTTLAAASYLSAQCLLELEFRNGAVYRYTDVPACVYQALLEADSKGTFFNHHIRNRFPYQQVGGSRQN